MNKLISKSPIQRFKQGKKIVKADLGTTLKALGYAVGLYTPESKNGIQKTPQITGDYVYTTGGRYGRMATQDEINKSWGSSKDQIVSKYLDDVTNTVDDNGNLIKKTTPVPKKGRKLIERDGTEYWLGSDGSKTLLKKGTGSVGRRLSTSRSGWSYGFDRSKEGIGDIAAMQRKLKAEGYYADDENSRDDGKWGQSTENAYKRYLAKQKAMELPPEVKIPDVVAPTNSVVTSTVTPTVTPLKTALLTSNTRGSNDASLALKRVLGKNNNFQGLTNFVWNENNVYPDEYSRGIAMDLRNMFSKFGDKQSWLDNQEDIERALNISGTYRGTRAGDYGDLARALATYNGIKDGEVYRFNTGLKYKTGGQLVSRNPITRFKNKKK